MRERGPLAGSNHGERPEREKPPAHRGMFILPDGSVSLPLRHENRR